MSWLRCAKPPTTETRALRAAYFVNAPPTQPFAEDSPVLELWAEHRNEFVDMGIRSGDLYTLYNAYFMASSGRGWGGNSRSIPKDPYRATEYGAALLPFANPQDADNIRHSIEQRPAALSVEQIAAATQAGDALRLQYFSGATPVENLHRVGTLRPERCAPSE